MLSDSLLLIWMSIQSRFDRDERGQTTSEYALVMLAAAAVAGLVLAWATKSHAISDLFDSVISRVLP
jgi:Flp pilus assembly pilin Flp